MLHLSQIATVSLKHLAAILMFELNLVSTAASEWRLQDVLDALPGIRQESRASRQQSPRRNAFKTGTRQKSHPLALIAVTHVSTTHVLVTSTEHSDKSNFFPCVTEFTTFTAAILDAPLGAAPIGPSVCSPAGSSPTRRTRPPHIAD